ncbi:MAG TPA: Crp/Fnr family transcriptional regulator [Hyphomonas sp.]|nr:Crp/Fnr family transcriptional regulator [Hyphomonas sp.]HRK68123.1 Crp/Fnr family transcriptional regulator [Hyphomonas sp.]
MPQEPNSRPQHPAQAAFERLGRIRVFKAGDEIIREGTRGDEVYFLLEGQVRIVNVSENGKEVVHCTLGQGTIFGEMAALTGAARHASVLSETTTRVASITRSEMRVLVQSDPSIALWMLEQLAHRLQQSNEMVRSIVSQSIAQRVRRELAGRGRPCDQGGAHLLIEPFPNLSEIARKLNTDRENVSREVSSLTARGILRREANRLVIVNPDFLLSTSGL